MGVLVLGSPEIVAAFALGGMPGRAVEKKDLRRVLDELGNDNAVQVLIVEETLADGDREAVERIKLDPGSPLLVEIAGLEGPLENRKTPLDLMRQALGIEF